jgi:HD-GYP domain-containing protein (c-di-GMP phosphodiesterase class II)
LNSKELSGKKGGSTGNEAFEILLEKPEDFESKVVPFAERYESLMESVASQAAIALENNQMIQRIQNEFDEFVKAAVSAIESRDPPTSGHSERVSAICVLLARAISSQKSGPFESVSFTENELKELELAGLLHDFGKVYIDPNIFLKGNKLYPRDLDYLRMRHSFLFRTVELSYSRKEINALVKKMPDKKAFVEKLRETRSRRLDDLVEIMRLIEILNKPTLQQGDPEDLMKRIDDLGIELRYKDIEGRPIPLLNDYERANFSIRYGSLNTEERAIIESHVQHSYNFASKIPWPPEYKNIPEILVKHHEKLDGSGYPNGLKGKDKIPLTARIMVVADIFDALTAPDRPYKSAVPMVRVKSILAEEAADGKLDGDVVELLASQRLYERAAGLRR